MKPASNKRYIFFKGIVKTMATNLTQQVQGENSIVTSSQGWVKTAKVDFYIQQIKKKIFNDKEK